MATPPLPAGYSLQDDTPPLPKGYTIRGDASPAPLSGPIGAAPIPAGLRGQAQPVIQPVANHGLGSAWDTAAAIPQHLGNMVSGVAHAFTDPLTTQEQQEFGTGQDVNALGHAVLGAKRMLIDPSLRNFQAGEEARKAGDMDGAITNYAQSVPIVGPMEKNLVNDAEQKGALPAVAGMLTDLYAAKGAGKVARAIANPSEVGAGMQETGLNRINSYLGTKPGDLRNGANPARAVINNVPGVPLSRSSLAGSLDSAQPIVGQQLGDTIRAADTNPNAAPITSQQLRPAVEDPIFGRDAEVHGPGGNLNNTGLNTLLSSMEKPAPGVSTPIYGPRAQPIIKPTQLWNTIQNMDKNLKFSTDPEVEGVNEVGRDVRGGLRQQLETADPNIKPISRQYGDIRAAQDVLDRKPHANGGVSLSIPHMVGRALNAAPIQVGLGKMGVAAGSGLSAVGKVLNPAINPAYVGNAAVMGALGGSNAVVDQNASPDNAEITDPSSDPNQSQTEVNLNQVAPAAPSIPPSPTLKPLDRATAEDYYDRAGGDPDAARAMAAKDGFDLGAQ